MPSALFLKSCIKETGQLKLAKSKFQDSYIQRLLHLQYTVIVAKKKKDLDPMQQIFKIILIGRANFPTEKIFSVC